MLFRRGDYHPPNRQYLRHPRYRPAGGGGKAAGQSCAIDGGDATSCAEVFGDPPQFPDQAGDNGRTFVYNCLSDGAIVATPGGFNRNSEKAYVCSTGGTFPNCDPYDCGRMVIDRVCGACPVSQDVYDGVCVPRIVANGVGKCRAAGWSVLS